MRYSVRWTFNSFHADVVRKTNSIGIYIVSFVENPLVVFCPLIVFKHQINVGRKEEWVLRSTAPCVAWTWLYRHGTKTFHTKTKAHVFPCVTPNQDADMLVVEVKLHTFLTSQEIWVVSFMLWLSLQKTEWPQGHSGSSSGKEENPDVSVCNRNGNVQSLNRYFIKLLHLKKWKVRDKVLLSKSGNELTISMLTFV